MPRYYFHLHGKQTRRADEHGVELPDGEAAWYQAVRSGREVIRADLHLGLPFDDQMIEIADARGTPLEHIQLADIARYAM